MSRTTAVLAVTLACSACGWGGDDAYSVRAVVDAFAREEMLLTEIIGEQPNSILVSSLGPRRRADECDDDLRVNVFRQSSDLDDYLRRVGRVIGKKRYVGRDEHGRRVVELVRRNVVAAVSADSACFTESRVAKAMERL